MAPNKDLIKEYFFSVVTTLKRLPWKRWDNSTCTTFCFGSGITQFLNAEILSFHLMYDAACSTASWGPSHNLVLCCYTYKPNVRQPIQYNYSKVYQNNYFLACFHCWLFAVDAPVVQSACPNWKLAVSGLLFTHLGIPYLVWAEKEGQGVLLFGRRYHLSLYKTYYSWFDFYI